jgi:hypothetical protein
MAGVLFRAMVVGFHYVTKSVVSYPMSSPAMKRPERVDIPISSSHTVFKNHTQTARIPNVTVEWLTQLLFRQIRIQISTPAFTTAVFVIFFSTLCQVL